VSIKRGKPAVPVLGKAIRGPRERMQRKKRKNTGEDASKTSAKDPLRDLLKKRGETQQTRGKKVEPAGEERKGDVIPVGKETR